MSTGRTYAGGALFTLPGGVPAGLFVTGRLGDTTDCNTWSTTELYCP